LDAALGFREHSGWGIAVVLAGTPRAPEVLERRRMLLCDPGLPRQPYHESEQAPLEVARAAVRQVEESARANGVREIGVLLGAAAAKGATVAVAAVGGKPVPLPPFEKIVRSHALLHAAEGELYREMLAVAAEECGLRVVRFVPKELFVTAAADLAMEPDALRERVASMGKPLGPPWTADHKEATAAAWLALARAKRSR
jgi:hypothetical protein